jgi:hypothetical protein
MAQEEWNLASNHIAERFGKGDGSATIIHAELAIDVAGMGFDRSRRDHQFVRNLLVRELLIEQVQNVQFAIGQRFQTLLPQ